MEYNEKQIQEMAKCMCSSYESKKGCKTCPTNWCYADECATMAYCNDYRKVDKDSVVLSKEEYQRNLNNSFNFGREENKKYYDNYVIPQKTKETANNILNEIECFLWETAINYPKDFEFCENIYRSIKEHFQNKYGVGIKENQNETII